MYLKLLFCVSLFAMSILGCQTPKSVIIDGVEYVYSSEPPEKVFAGEEVVTYSERMPEVIGGIERIYKNVYYPATLRKNYIEGRVIVQFVVYKDGRIGPVSVVSSPHPELGQAAVDALSGVTFRPGIHYGKIVNVLYQMPFEFRVKDK
ncbi:energy transducer TonB [bacterium]|nr:MAG: energy transducer TonB [bacterium]